MTSAGKKQRVKEIATEGQTLVNQAETLLQQVMLRNVRLGQEMKQTRIELEERLGSKTK